jgi:hypothetical protein
VTAHFIHARSSFRNEIISDTQLVCSPLDARKPLKHRRITEAAQLGTVVAIGDDTGVPQWQPLRECKQCITQGG